jgi:hypothetical protein
MPHLLPSFPARRSLRHLLAAAILLAGPALTTFAADAPKSLLPIFGTKGWTMQGKGMQGYDIRGWLPKDWIDNSSWAPVSGVYTQLNDAPAPEIGAVRIEVTKLHSHHLQMTTKSGAQPYKKGTTYVLSGWIRGPQDADVYAGFREDAEPHKYYAGQNLSATAEWQRFSTEWTPEMDTTAWVMFSFHKIGSVDLAGISLEEKK